MGRGRTLLRQILARHQAWLLLALTILPAVAGAWAISLAIEVPSRDEFNIVRWELRHVPGKWLYLTGRFFRGELSPAEEEERLGRFLLLSARIRALERSFSDEDAAQREELRQLVRERDALENDAEAIIEGRLTSVLEDAGLESSIPLFPSARWVFPPVDFELDQPPRVLAVSPRDRIELVEQRPLRPGLGLEEAVRVEEEVEKEGGRSALVEGIAGAATYPSIVAPQREYEGLVDTVAHEWVHQYLFFQPLGSRFLASLELQTLNETVANVAGRDLAVLLVRRYPLAPGISSQVSALAPAEAAVDVGGFLRELRLEVETLLTSGQIEAAEALMEQRRLELAEQGVAYRRINQAFFASRSVYADTPASIDPLGEKVRALRDRSGSVGEFLRAASRLTSGAALDRLLSERQQAGAQRAAAGRITPA